MALEQTLLIYADLAHCLPQLRKAGFGLSAALIAGLKLGSSKSKRHASTFSEFRLPCAFWRLGLPIHCNIFCKDCHCWHHSWMVAWQLWLLLPRVGRIKTFPTAIS